MNVKELESSKSFMTYCRRCSAARSLSTTKNRNKIPSEIVHEPRLPLNISVQNNSQCFIRANDAIDILEKQVHPSLRGFSQYLSDDFLLVNITIEYEPFSALVQLLTMHGLIENPLPIGSLNSTPTTQNYVDCSGNNPSLDYRIRRIREVNLYRKSHFHFMIKLYFKKQNQDQNLFCIRRSGNFKIYFVPVIPNIFSTQVRELDLSLVSSCYQSCLYMLMVFNKPFYICDCRSPTVYKVWNYADIAASLLGDMYTSFHYPCTIINEVIFINSLFTASEEDNKIERLQQCNNTDNSNIGVQSARNLKNYNHNSLSLPARISFYENFEIVNYVNLISRFLVRRTDISAIGNIKCFNVNNGDS